jgi:hypothetical protein
MAEYRKPKGLKLKKFKKPKVQVSTESPSMPQTVSEPPKNLKIKRAEMGDSVKMSDINKKPKPKSKEGKIIRIKAGGGKYYQSDRIKEEIKTESMVDDMVEALRYGSEKQLNKKLKKKLKVK